MDVPRLQLVRWALLVVLTFVLLILCFGTPPFWVGDETLHFERADSISRGAILPTIGQDPRGNPAAGGPLHEGVEEVLAATRVANDFANFERTSIGKTRALLFAHFGAPEPFAVFTNSAVYPPILYAPASAAISVSRAFGATALASVYAGRVANVLLFSAMLAWLLARRPQFADFALCCAAVPILLFDTASLSADAILMPTVILFACLLVAIPNESAADRSWPLVLTMFVLTVGKVAYLPLAIVPYLLALMVDRRFSSRVIFLLIAAAFCTVSWSAWTFLVRHAAISARSAEGITSADIRIDPVGQLKWIAAHPMWFGKIALHQIRQDWRGILLRTFGSRLGWGTVVAPGWLSLSSALCMLLSAMSLRPRPGGLLATSVVFAVSIACATIILLLLYLQIDVVGAQSIDGIQGRYFLPLVIVMAPWVPRLFDRHNEKAGLAAAVVAVATSSAYLLLQIPRWWIP